MDAPLLYKLTFLAIGMATLLSCAMCIHLYSKSRSLISVNKLYKTACQTAGTGIWEYLPSCNSISLSQEWFTLTSRNPSTFGNPIIDLDSFLTYLHPDDCRSFRSFIDNMATSDSEVKILGYRIATGDGQWLPLKCMAIARRAQSANNHDSSDYSVIAIEYDASRINKHFSRIRQVFRETGKLRSNARSARDNSELSVKAQTQFLATMSHEIRTPINVIIGFAQIMADDQFLDDNQRESLDIILKSSGHLLSLINGILDWSRIESGSFKLNNETIHLPTFVNDISALFSLKQNKRNVELIIQHSADLPEFIETDPLRLRQICMNLLSNAMKFTSEGTVTFSTNSILEHGKCTLVFDVIDTGIGIKSSDREKIFKAFSQCSNIDKMAEGSGLGLFISKKIVNELGGEITFNSIEGQGCHFSFMIPVCLSSAQEFYPESDTGSNSVPLSSNQDDPNTCVKHILIVDDNPATLRLLKQQLARIGFSVDSASNGKEALARWMENDYCAVLTDCSMPIMDGFDLCKSIRLNESQRQARRTPIIALTGSVEEYRQKCTESGIDSIIGKPFHYEELKSAVTPLMQIAV